MITVEIFTCHKLLNGILQKSIEELEHDSLRNEEKWCEYWCSLMAPRVLGGDYLQSQGFRSIILVPRMYDIRKHEKEEIFGLPRAKPKFDLYALVMNNDNKVWSTSLEIEKQNLENNDFADCLKLLESSVKKVWQRGITKLNDQYNWRYAVYPAKFWVTSLMENLFPNHFVLVNNGVPGTLAKQFTVELKSSMGRGLLEKSLLSRKEESFYLTLLTSKLAANFKELGIDTNYNAMEIGSYDIIFNMVKEALFHIENKLWENALQSFQASGVVEAWQVLEKVSTNEAGALYHWLIEDESKTTRRIQAVQAYPAMMGFLFQDNDERAYPISRSDIVSAIDNGTSLEQALSRNFNIPKSAVRSLQGLSYHDIASNLINWHSNLKWIHKNSETMENLRYPVGDNEDNRRAWWMAYARLLGYWQRYNSVLPWESFDSMITVQAGQKQEQLTSLNLLEISIHEMLDTCLLKVVYPLLVEACAPYFDCQDDEQQIRIWTWLRNNEKEVIGNFIAGNKTPVSLAKTSQKWHEKEKEIDSQAFNSCSWPGLFLSPIKWKNAEFRPLTTAHQLKEEGERMRHCVGTYSYMCIYSGLQIFDMRTEDEESTLALSISKKGKISVYAHHGFKNARVSHRSKKIAQRLVSAVNSDKVINNKRELKYFYGSKTITEMQKRVGFDFSNEQICADVYQAWQFLLPISKGKGRNEWAESVGLSVWIEQAAEHIAQIPLDVETSVWHKIKQKVLLTLG